MKHVLKPLEVKGWRLYKVRLSFAAHPVWNEEKIVAATSASHAVAVIEQSRASTQWKVKPLISAHELPVYQPEEWLMGTASIDAA